MTDLVVDEATSGHRTRTADTWSSRWYVASVAATIVPVWVAVWRVASSGFMPVGDTALTVMRARDVFTRHPPLIGMPAASGSYGDTITHFPGAIQLYVLAVPVKLFGNVWGPGIAMAFLSTLWIVLAAVALHRVLGPGRGLIGIAVLGVYAWSIGIGLVIDPVPAAMLTFTLLPFLLLAWCASTGDRVALVSAAIMANYLWLDHLALVVLVPIVAAVALLGYVLAYRHRWWSRVDEHRDERRGAWRGLGIAAALSALMWLPTLIAEVTSSPGNLHLLTESSGHEREVVASWSFAGHVMVDLVTYPRFWLKGSFDDPPFQNTFASAVPDGSSAAYAVVAGALLIVVFALLGRVALRRGDRIARWALITAAAAMVAAVVTIYFTPTRFGITGYVRPLWAVAAFVWCAVAVCLTRLLRRPRFVTRPRAIGVLVSVVLVFVFLNLPKSNRGYVPDSTTTRVVREVDAAVLARVRNGQSVALRTRPDYGTQKYFGALVLALRTANVDFCVLSGSPPLAGVDRCDGRERLVLAIDASSRVGSAVLSAPTTVVAASPLTDAEHRRLRGLERRVAAWLTSGDDIELSPAAERFVATYGTDVRDVLAPLLDPTGSPAPLSTRENVLKGLVGYWAADATRAHTEPFVGAPVSINDLRAWSALTDSATYVVVTEV